MSLISHNELILLQEQGVIQFSDPSLVNAASIDIRLGNKILTEVKPYKQPKVSLKHRDALYMNELTLGEDGYTLEPGEFILASSLEIFNLPETISAEYKLKSSLARVGLEHLKAGWCDAGWNGSVLTLELVNLTRFHSIQIRPGDKIGQVVFFRHEQVPSNASYAQKGRYNGDKEVSGVKKDTVILAEPYIKCTNCED